MESISLADNATDNIQKTFLKPVKELKSGYDPQENTQQTGVQEKTAIPSEFCAEEFVDCLLNEGCDTTCDETSKAFNEHITLPSYYDEQMYKDGQGFFYKHIFGLFFSKLLGLIAQLLLPTINILMMTNKSSIPLTAYRRYMATILHMRIWYDEDPKPGSRLWNSISKVRTMHNSASKKAVNAGLPRISQKDMALTQFSFMGLGVVRSEMMGIHNATDKEVKSFIHLWRVVGSIFGIEERFNICRESVEETKEICNLIIKRVFIPLIEKPGEDFMKMSKALLEGMWVMNPVLQHDVFVYYLNMAMTNTNNCADMKTLVKDTNVKLLNRGSRIKLNAMMFALWSLQYAVVRIYFKYVQIASLWMMSVCPLLVYYKFRIKSIVEI